MLITTLTFSLWLVRPIVSDCLSRYNYENLTDLADDIKEQFKKSIIRDYSSYAMSYAIHGYEYVSELQPSSVTFEYRYQLTFADNLSYQSLIHI